jgi:hypothetical protein
MTLLKKNLALFVSLSSYYTYPKAVSRCLLAYLYFI